MDIVLSCRGHNISRFLGSVILLPVIVLEYATPTKETALPPLSGDIWTHAKIAAEAVLRAAGAEQFASYTGSL